jgi:hypothetical protein
MNHNEAQVVIARHLKGKPYTTIVVDELCDGSFGYTRRLDVVAFTPNAKLLKVVEVKVSRTDFQRGLAKFASYMKLCHQFYVGAPAGMIAPTELPDGVGLLEITNGRVRTKRYAPKREMEPGLYAYVLSRFLQKLIVQRDRQVEIDFLHQCQARNQFTFWMHDMEHHARTLHE